MFIDIGQAMSPWKVGVEKKDIFDLFRLLKKVYK